MIQQTQLQVIENEASDAADGAWLTAKEVMDATGITKDDLIQFIEKNVLPKSMMRVQATENGANRKKSYFSPTLLGHVAMLKLLRDEGHSVEAIAKELGPTETNHSPFSSQGLSEAPYASPEYPENKSKGPDEQLLNFPLSGSSIKGSAFFVNRDMQLGWVKVASNDGLFKIIREEMQDDPSGSVFDILLRASLKELVFNWQPLFSFIYRFLEEVTPEQIFKRGAPLVSLHIEELHQPESSFIQSQDAQPRIDSCPIEMEDEKGRMKSMRLYAMPLSEGSLFIFQEDRWSAQQSRWHAQPDGSGIRRPRGAVDEKIPFSVISAKLDNAQRVVDTLLPEAYFQLITSVWDAVDLIAETYGGRRSKRNGTEVQYVIPQHSGTDPAFDAIRCAIEMREKVGEIEASLKAKGRWFAHIRLNIGISSGKDFLPKDDLTACMAFMLPGGAADQAFYLSTIAKGGNILITKSAFGHLSQRQRDGLTFGIYHENHLIANIFNQVSELPQTPEAPPMPKDINSLFTTCIVDLRHKKASPS